MWERCVPNSMFSFNMLLDEWSLNILFYLKGMAGGEVVILPVESTGFRPEDATIVGNTCLYGATGGLLFVRGKAGERFAVRNSLAQAVVEGTGDHCCEYMTGGCVVVLGK